MKSQKRKTSYYSIFNDSIIASTSTIYSLFLSEGEKIKPSKTTNLSFFVSSTTIFKKGPCHIIVHDFPSTFGFESCKIFNFYFIKIRLICFLGDNVRTFVSSWNKILSNRVSYFNYFF